MKQKGIQLHEGVPELKQQQKWFPAQGGVLILDNIISEGEMIKKSWISSPNIHIIEHHSTLPMSKHVFTQRIC